MFCEICGSKRGKYYPDLLITVCRKHTLLEVEQLKRGGSNRQLNEGVDSVGYPT